MINLWTKYKQVRALKRLFFESDGKLKEDAKIVLEWLRDEVGGKGRRLNQDGRSLLFSADGRFDAAMVAYMAGSRRVYDLLISRLAVDENEVFNLAAMSEAKREDDLLNDLTLI